MKASKEEVRQWIKTGQDKGASYMFIITKEFSINDSASERPLYSNLDLSEVSVSMENLDGNMQLLEIYDLSKDIEKQLSQHRAMEF